MVRWFYVVVPLDFYTFYVFLKIPRNWKVHGCTDLVKDEELYNVSSLTSAFVDDTSWSWGSKTWNIYYEKFIIKCRVMLSFKIK